MRADDALGEAALDDGPFFGGDDAGKEVVGKDALGAFIAAVDGEGDALIEEGEVGGLFAALELVGRKGGEVIEQGLVVAVEGVARLEHLVVGVIQHVVGKRGWIELSRGRGWHRSLEYRGKAGWRKEVVSGRGGGRSR